MHFALCILNLIICCPHCGAQGERKVWDEILIFRTIMRLKTKKQTLLKIISLASLSGAVGICICYLVFMNKLSVSGFELSKLHQDLTNLQDQNSALEIKAMELESYKHINKKISQLNMVEAGKVDYVLSSASFVAKK